MTEIGDWRDISSDGLSFFSLSDAADEVLQLVEEQAPPPPPPSRFLLKKPAAPVSGGGSENLRQRSLSWGPIQ